MRKAAYLTGCALALCGAAALASWSVYALWFWFTEIAVFHWNRGNPWPFILPIAIAASFVGVSLAASFEAKDS